MKNLIESIFDEKDQMDNIDINAELNMISKYQSKSFTYDKNKVQDCKGNIVEKGDMVIFSNGIQIYLGLVTDIDEGELCINYTGKPNGVWWYTAYKTLKIDQKIAKSIVKLIK